ncbi:MAG: hypothetical protein HC869_12925, partial [Rhodospirillales bacterium]|nr:hypothetical protein [Rhodospirillales bacterium]
MGAPRHGHSTSRRSSGTFGAVTDADGENRLPAAPRYLGRPPERRQIQLHGRHRCERGKLSSWFAASDRVHVATSLAGFEALMHGVPVSTYGMPFYAGWGLTEDQTQNSRRTRSITLDELVAAALILYPRYVSIISGLRCEPEDVLDEIEAIRARDQPPASSGPRTSLAHELVVALQ